MRNQNNDLISTKMSSGVLAWRTISQKLKQLYMKKQMATTVLFNVASTCCEKEIIEPEIIYPTECSPTQKKVTHIILENMIGKNFQI